MSEYENLRTAHIVAPLDWKVDVIFGFPGDGINGFTEALRTRQNKIRFILVRHEESGAFMACGYATLFRDQVRNISKNIHGHSGNSGERG